MASFIRSGFSLGESSTRYEGPSFEHRPEEAPSKSHTAQRDRTNKLRKTVEAEIIPRLMMLHGGSKEADREVASNDNLMADFDVAGFAQIVLDFELSVAQSYVERLLEQGASLDGVLLGLLAPVARHLGELWSSDARNFAEVTIALGNLHLLLREYGPELKSECREGEQIVGCRAVLSPVRGDRHIFGVCVLDLYLRQSGCEVDLFPRFDLPMMTRRVNTEWFDVIGLSASCDVLIDELSSDIRKLRRASFNSSVEVIVGGPAFSGHPERVASVGADGFAEDAHEAISLVAGINKKSVRD